MAKLHFCFFRFLLFPVFLTLFTACLSRNTALGEGTETRAKGTPRGLFDGYSKNNRTTKPPGRGFRYASLFALESWDFARL